MKFRSVDRNGKFCLARIFFFVEFQQFFMSTHEICQLAQLDSFPPSLEFHERNFRNFLLRVTLFHTGRRVSSCEKLFSLISKSFPLNATQFTNSDRYFTFSFGYFPFFQVSFTRETPLSVRLSEAYGLFWNFSLWSEPNCDEAEKLLCRELENLCYCLT